MKKLLCLLSLISGFSYGLQPVTVDLKTETFNICDKLTDTDDQHLCVTMGSNVHILKYIERQTDIYHVWNDTLVNITIKNPSFLMQLPTLDINYFKYGAWNLENSFYVSIQYRKDIQQHIIAIVNLKPNSYCVGFYIDDYKKEIDSKVGFADIYSYEKIFVENQTSTDLGVVYFNKNNILKRFEVKGEKCNVNDFIKNKK